MSPSTAIRVEDGRHVVGWTTDGRDFRPVKAFATPRLAIDFATGLDARPAPRQASRPDLAVGALGGAGESEDVAAAPIEAPDLEHPAALVCAGCGGPIPVGSHGQRRTTCSAACRQRVRYRRAAQAGGGDTGSGTANLTPSRPSVAVTPDPTPRAAVEGDALPTAAPGAGAEPIPVSPEPDPDLAFGL